MKLLRLAILGSMHQHASIDLHAPSSYGPGFGHGNSLRLKPGAVENLLVPNLQVLDLSNTHGGSVAVAATSLFHLQVDLIFSSW